MNTTFKPLEKFGGPLQQGVLPVICQIGGEFFACGTAFVVSTDGLLLTATHVLRYAASLAHVKYPVRDNARMDFGLYLLFASDERHGDNNEYFVGGLVPVDRAASSQSCDIAILSASFPRRADGSSFANRIASLRPGFPSLGAGVGAFGYHGMNHALASEIRDGRLHLQQVQETAISTGNILEIHGLHRDLGLLSFPCFKTSARFAHGMSGGPVFSDGGHVVGVITSGSTFEDASYASLLYPAFGVPFFCSLLGEGQRLTNLFELAELGIIKTDGSHRDLKIGPRAPDGSVDISIRVPRTTPR